MEKGVLPVRRAYVFALETIHAGVSEMPCEPPTVSVYETIERVEETHEVADLARGNEVVEAVHNFLDGGVPVPLREPGKCHALGVSRYELTQ